MSILPCYCCVSSGSLQCSTMFYSLLAPVLSVCVCCSVTWTMNEACWVYPQNSKAIRAAANHTQRTATPSSRPAWQQCAHSTTLGTIGIITGSQQWPRWRHCSCCHCTRDSRLCKGLREEGWREMLKIKKRSLMSTMYWYFCICRSENKGVTMWVRSIQRRWMTWRMTICVAHRRASFLAMAT